VENYNSICILIDETVYHNGMARPWVVDGGDGLQTLKVAANILNEQSQTADRSGLRACRVDMWLTTPHHKNNNLLRNVTQDLVSGIL
jgi:hypothetical protein